MTKNIHNYKNNEAVHKEQKNDALNNLIWNFTEVIINANKVVPKNLVAVRQLSDIRLITSRASSVGRLERCGWSLNVCWGNFRKVDAKQHNFQELLCWHSLYQLCKIKLFSAQVLLLMISNNEL